MPAQSKKSGTKTKGELRERRLRRCLDWIAYIACAALVALIAWLATTRPLTPLSFTGTSDLLSCTLAPLSTISAEGEPIEYPHFHVPADALVVTSTTLRVTSGDEEPSDARDSVPQSPQATAVIKFGRRYTVRLYMHKGWVLSLMPGKAVPVAAVKPWSSLGTPDRYTIAFLFHYPPDVPIWKVVGTEEVDLTLRTLGFDRDQILEKPIGKRLQISGIPHFFPRAPVALGPSDWPPLIGQFGKFGPNGQTADYESMLFVSVLHEFNTELVEASPLMCENATFVGAIGELSLSTNGQLLRGPVYLRAIGELEVRATSDNEQIKYTVTGTTTSATVGGRELVPTRLDAVGPFWANLLSALAAALVVALIATKGRIRRS